VKDPGRFILIPLHNGLIFQTDYATSAWAVLSRFGSRESLLKELSGAKVHRLENAMTMCHDARCLSDRLEMWLEPTVRMM
jgi:hypothetical protein